MKFIYEVFKFDRIFLWLKVMQYFVKKYSNCNFRIRIVGLERTCSVNKNLKERKVFYIYVKYLKLMWKCDLNILHSVISFCTTIQPLFLKKYSPYSRTIFNDIVRGNLKRDFLFVRK